jgi:hypothetical protein
MATPLRSNPITGPSSLLRASPPLWPASVLRPLRLLAAWGALRIGATGSCVPYRSLSQGHAAFMPDADWAVSRHLPILARGTEIRIPLSTSPEYVTKRHQRFTGVRLLELTLGELIARSQMIGEHPGRRLHQCLLPRVDLVGMDPEASCELGHCRFLTKCGECNLGLESGILFASSCSHFLPPARCLAGLYYGAGCTLASCLNFGVHLRLSVSVRIVLYQGAIYLSWFAGRITGSQGE